jgi:hypothetical protein
VFDEPLLDDEVVFELPEAEELWVVELVELLLPQPASNRTPISIAKTMVRWTRIARNGSDRPCESRKWVVSCARCRSQESCR